MTLKPCPADSFIIICEAVITTQLQASSFYINQQTKRLISILQKMMFNIFPLHLNTYVMELRTL